MNSVLSPPGDDGTKSTNAVTPAAPTPLSTAELASADLTVDLRLQACGARIAVGMTPTGAIGGTCAPP